MGSSVMMGWTEEERDLLREEEADEAIDDSRVRDEGGGGVASLKSDELAR
jgi:hypothetical protein